MALKLYNTMSGKLEEFEPIGKKKPKVYVCINSGIPNDVPLEGEEEEVKMYVCGLTPYDFSHIGHARAAVAFDVLRRYLEFKGYKVRHLSNFTDIDDKIIKRANEENKTTDEIVETYIKDYLDACNRMNIKSPEIFARATSVIPEILDIVKTLIDKGYAYEMDGDVYYDTTKFKDYGKLSHQTLETIKSGARIAVDERKKNPTDFALWKRSKEGEPSWESPWGNGRPGWHIECSAMIRKYLGESIDIHGGGSDLIFPHHENEIAQSEAATGKMLAKYWIHNALVMISKEKMSKSLKNYFTLKEALQNYKPDVLRFYLISAQYRKPLDFSIEALEQAKTSLERVNNSLYNIKTRMREIESENVYLSKKGSYEKEEFQIDELESFKKRFLDAMDDDLNVPGALGAMFEFTRYVNDKLDTINKKKPLDKILETYQEFGSIFGLFGKIEELKPPIPESEILDLIRKREDARKKNDWRTSDDIRKNLEKEGIMLEDTPKGTTWKLRY